MLYTNASVRRYSCRPWISCYFFVLSEWILPQSSTRLRGRVAKASTPLLSTSVARPNVSCANPKACGSAYVCHSQFTAAGKDPRAFCPPPMSDPERFRVNRGSASPARK